jgi:hypothetical protein
MRNAIVVLLACVSTVLVGFFAGPFFLLPYYSISGNYRLYSQHNSIDNTTKTGSLVNLTDVCRGPLPNSPEILFLSVTRLNDLRKRNLTLHAVLWTQTNDELSCPEGFEHESDWIINLDSQATQYRDDNFLECFQWRTKTVSFFDFIRDEWEHDIDYNGPIIQSQYISHTTWDLSGLTSDKIHSVHMQAFIFDFGTRTEQKSCATNTTGCDTFFQRLSNETDVPYLHENGYCIADSSCAAVIKLGGQSCHDNYIVNTNERDTNTSCAFTMHYMVFDALPSVYKFGNVWTYDVVAFVACLAMWLFAMLFAARIWHKLYLRRYNVSADPYCELHQGCVYDLRLRFSGEPFSKYTGQLKLVDNDQTLYFIPLAVTFGAEDVAGTHVAFIMEKYLFEIDQDANCQCELEWDGEFEQASFKSPHVQVTLKRKLPRTVGAISSIIFMPLVALQQICTNYPRRRMFVRFGEYWLLSIYLVLLHSSWIIALLYLLLNNLHAVENILYGYVNTKPVWSIVFYAVFLIFIIGSCVFPTIIKPIWWREKRISNKVYFMDGGHKYKSNETNPEHISHIDIEYFALKEKHEEEAAVNDSLISSD